MVKWVHETIVCAVVDTVKNKRWVSTTTQLPESSVNGSLMPNQILFS